MGNVIDLVLDQGSFDALVRPDIEPELLFPALHDSCDDSCLLASLGVVLGVEVLDTGLRLPVPVFGLDFL